MVWALSCLAVSCKRGSDWQFSGTIETDEIRVASRYGGRVEVIGAWEGDNLTNGQLIAALDAAELQAQRDKAAALLAEMKAGPRAEEIAAAKREWEAVSAELEFARVEAKRAQELLGQRAISESERDRAVSRALTLEKSAAAAKSRYDLLQAGTRPEQIAQAQAALAEIEARLREMQVFAPTNSVLEVLYVRKGDVLAPNQPVATLIVPQRIWVRVYVPEPMLAQLRLGQRISVRVDGFADREFAGVIEQINRSAEFTPRNVQTAAERIKQVFGVKIALDNSQGLLRGGMGAEAVFDQAGRGRRPRRPRRVKLQAPIPNTQRSPKRQYPNGKMQFFYWVSGCLRASGALGIGAWGFSGYWVLVLGSLADPRSAAMSRRRTG